ncbi:MAG: extracellular solute-binding protein [bacterium]|nr:extracellular solute-binding protein [bacterium]
MAESKTRENPLYTQLKDQLVKRIARGIYKPGEPIPSEAEIAKEFGVSVFTVRQAVALLVADNVLIKQQGRRTYVAEQKTKLTLFTWLTETKQGEHTLQDVLKRFEKKYPSLTVECLPTTYSTARRDLLQRISTGNAPDVAHIASHWTSYFAYMGAFIKLEELLDEHNLENRLYDKDLWGGMYRNRLYSVAWGLCPIALIANKDVLREAGLTQIDPPITLDTLWKICTRLEEYFSRKKIYSYGFNLIGDETDFLHLYTFLQSFNGGFAETQGTVQFNSAENVAAFRWLKNFIREFRVLFTDFDTIRQRFAQGEIAFISDGPRSKALLENLTNKPFEKHFEVFLNPMDTSSASSSWVYNHALAICSQSRHTVQAATLIDALTNDREISNYYYSQLGHLPVNQTYLHDPVYHSEFYQVYKQQLLHARCINAQNMMFGKALDFCIDAMKNILFEGVDIQQELDEKEYILNMLYSA